MTVPLCQICNRRTANYVCQDCGKNVCSNCFDPTHWSCIDCQAKLKPAEVQRYTTTAGFSLATWLFFIAFAIIFIGMLLMTFGSISNLGNASGGAVILIGPIPIVLGTGPYSLVLVGLALVVTIVALAFFLLLRRKV